MNEICADSKLFSECLVVQLCISSHYAVLRGSFLKFLSTYSTTINNKIIKRTQSLFFLF